MNPLIALALADLARAGQLKERRAIARREEALDVIERDSRWASAISKWARTEHVEPGSRATPDCATA